MLTQKNRTLKIVTPLGDDVLLITGFRGTEGISIPFSFELDLISEQQHSIKFKDIIGKNVTVSIELPEGEQRFFNGVISAFSQRSTEEDENGQSTSYYSATMVPWIWLLTMSSNIRIFQQKHALKIIEELLNEKGITDFSIGDVKSSPEVREYCVQYRETDFNFISRLLEEEGICYFFKHENGKHTLILADNVDAHKACPFQEEAVCHAPTSGENKGYSVIQDLEISQEIRPGKFVLSDFNFETPTTNLLVEIEGKEELALSPGVLEIYDAPGEFYARAAGDAKVKNRIEEEEVQVVELNGSSDIPPFSSGFKFKLSDFFRADLNNKHYLLTLVSHSITQTFGQQDKETGYSNSFSCIPITIPYRPVRKTPKPIVEGVHTAIVVGSAGEEIETDEYGRIKVQFHWDRLGKYDEKSSCWMRVCQPWAGTKWGAMTIPRVGQEVVVNFIDGDPDRPIVTGTVYNKVNMPPYTLPDEKTKTTLKTNSSKGGGGYNELRFEDKAGDEEIFIHAQKDYNNFIQNDFKATIANDSHFKIVNNHFEEVGADKHLTVGGDHNEKTDGTISVEAGSDLQIQSGNNTAIDSGSEIHLKGGMKVIIEAGMQISLEASGSFIDIGPSGVSIKGPMVNINSGGAAGSGSGASPGSPEPPKEVKPGDPGGPTELPPAKEYTPNTILTSQAKVFKQAAKSGTPLCET